MTSVAAILTVGDELMLGDRVDTNGRWLSVELRSHGIETTERRSVHDRVLAISIAMTSLAMNCDLLLVTGGLGPTEDDRTREALAEAMGKKLNMNGEAHASMSSWFAKRGAVMPPANDVQAMVPEGSSWIPNMYGTAPGLKVKLGDCIVLCLPGPPNEMQPMFQDAMADVYSTLDLGEPVITTEIHSWGMAESIAGEKIEKLRNQTQEYAELLSGKRHDVAKLMDIAIVDELRQLGMEKARFETHIVSASFAENREACTTKGIDQVEFMLTVNPGQDMRSLVKVASGGELSRIMLALKTVLTSLDSVEILIFDEVDTGISGGIAEIVGQKLHSLGERHQTLCVTHLPQIAAFAEHHYFVSKHLTDSETYTKIKLLNTENERIRALADLIGGQEITEQTLELAQEMLQSFQKK